MMQHSAPMRRRTIVRLAAAGVLASSVGFGWRNLPVTDTRLVWTPAIDAIMRALAPVLMAGVEDPHPPALDLDAHIGAVRQVISTMPAHMQADLTLLCRALTLGAGRWLLTGLQTDWSTASPQDVNQALLAMSRSRWLQRRQAYQALRNLHLAAWYADLEHGRPLGYPGPMNLG